MQRDIGAVGRRRGCRGCCGAAAHAAHKDGLTPERRVRIQPQQAVGKEVRRLKVRAQHPGCHRFAQRQAALIWTPDARRQTFWSPREPGFVSGSLGRSGLKAGRHEGSNVTQTRWLGCHPGARGPDLVQAGNRKGASSICRPAFRCVNGSFPTCCGRTEIPHRRQKRPLEANLRPRVFGGDGSGSAGARVSVP